MKNKIVFMVANLFAFVFLLGLVSATISITDIPTLGQTSGSFDVTISSDQNETINLSIADITQGSESITFALSDDSFELNNSSNNKTVTVSYTISSWFCFDFVKDPSTTLIASGTVSSDSTKQINFPVSSFCEFGERGDLEITAIDVNNKGSGDDNEWEFLDTIEVEISVENTDNDDSISSVEARIVILDQDGEDFTSDFIDDRDDRILDFGKIKDGDEETKTFFIKVDPTIDEGNYLIYVKAYKDGNEDDHCTQRNDDFDGPQDSYEFEVTTGDKEMAIDDINSPGTLACETPSTISFDFYNFDISDKEEDMRINLYNHELGINLYTEKFDLRKGKYKRISFDINIPKDAEEKTYKLRVFAEYDYDEDDDQYGEEDEVDLINLKVEGNCRVDLTPLVSAVLESEKAEEGEEIIIKAKITNDDATAVFSFNAEDYGGWAQLVEISSQTENIELGEEKEITFKFELNDDSKGEQTFNIVISSEGEIVATQPVAVMVEEGSGLKNFFKNMNLEWDSTTIGIIVLNLILIVAIIIVARKILRKK